MLVLFGGHDGGPRDDTWELSASVSGEYVAGGGPGPSNPPRVRVFEEGGGETATDFLAYAASEWGANVCAGDLTLGGLHEILTGPGPGALYGPHVRAFTAGGSPLARVSFYAYGTLRYGAKVGGARLDGDAYHEILTTPGPGEVFGPHVRGFDFDNAQVQAIPNVSFFAYGTLKYGANGADGDVDRDGYGEILAGPGPGAVFGSHLRGFDYDGASISSMAPKAAESCSLPLVGVAPSTASR